MAKNQVAKKQGTEVSTNVMDDLEQHAGQDHFEREDLAIPILRILQKGSPQVDKDEGEYIKGAEPGMIFNTATQELVSGEKGILVVPVKYTRNYSKWVPREKGGGLVANYDSDPTEFERAHQDPDNPRKRYDDDGNEVVDMAFYYIVRLDEEDKTPLEQAIIAMGSTQWAVARRWNTVIKTAQLKKPDGGLILSPPIYAFVYRLTTTRQSNDKGTWYSWKVTREAPVPELDNGSHLLGQAKELRQLVDSGATKPGYEDAGAPGDDVDF